MISKFHSEHVMLKIGILLLFIAIFSSSASAANNQVRNSNNFMSNNMSGQLLKAIRLSVSENIDDKKKAFKIYSSLAAQGVNQSYYYLGHYYSSESKVTSRDYNKAIYFYRKAAEAGEKNAASTLASFYAIGVLGEKDYVAAAKWYEKSIEMGNKSDLLKLGYFYQNGYGVKRDYDKAMSLYKEALANGIDDSQKSIDDLVRIVKTKDMLYGKVVNRIINATLFDYITTISLLMAIVFYLKSKKDKILKYDIRTFNIIKNNINNYELLRIEYDAHKIENLSISKVAIWNAGKDSVRNADIPKSNPISINAADGIILNSNVITQNNNSNMFSCAISDDKHSAIINFEFIDYDNAAIVEVLHTSANVSVNGCVIGGKEFSKSQFAKLSPQMRNKSITGILITTILFVIVDVTAIYNYNDIVKSEPELMVIIFLAVFAFTAFCILLIFGCISLLRSKPMSGFDIEP